MAKKTTCNRPQATVIADPTPPRSSSNEEEQTKPAPPPRFDPPSRIDSGLVFLSLLLLLAGFSPGKVLHMGYESEVAVAGNSLLRNAANVLTGRPLLFMTDGPRHGFIETFLQMPLLLVSHFLPPGDAASVDWVLSFHPVIVTALIGTILFIWTARIMQSNAWGLSLAIVGVFGTLLWPYAYIGMEPSQSLFLLLGGFIAFGIPRTGRWLQCMGLACALGIALSAKLNGTFLVPAIVWALIWYFQSTSPVSANKWKRGAQALVTLLILVGFRAFAVWTQSLYWAPRGGTSTVIHDWLDLDLINVILRFWCVFLVPNKAFFLFSPLTIFAALATASVLSKDFNIAMFTGLALAGQAGGISLLRAWSDEVWGSRYLHACVPLMIVCVALAVAARPLTLFRKTSLISLSAVGICISFLGSFTYYGNLYSASIATKLPTLDALQTDLTYNQIHFNAQLLSIWFRSRVLHKPPTQPTLWPYPRAFQPWPPEACTLSQPTPVDLRILASAQPAVLQSWEPGAQFITRLPIVFLLAGGVLLGFLVRRFKPRKGAFAEP